MNRLLQTARNDGWYVLGSRVLSALLGSVRNRCIARRCGVRKIRIGPQSRLSGLSFMTIGEEFSAEEGLWIEALGSRNGQTFTPRITIGQRVRASRFVHIAATHLVEIGDDVLIGSNVLITDHNHGQYSIRHSSPHVAPAQRALDDDRQVRIGSNVWLGDGVVVAAGASIGDGAVIGAHSVVLGNIPAYALAAGLPATVRKTYSFTTREWSA